MKLLEYEAEEISSTAALFRKNSVMSIWRAAYVGILKLTRRKPC
jgi:hypothetical protein